MSNASVLDWGTSPSITGGNKWVGKDITRLKGKLMTQTYRNVNKPSCALS